MGVRVVLFVITGLLLMGEAGTRLIDVVFTPSDWGTYRNLLFLALDLLTGAMLLLFAGKLGPRMMPLLVFCVLGLALATHAVRGIEFRLGAPEAYILNHAQELLNLAKLILTGGLLVSKDRFGPA